MPDLLKLTGFLYYRAIGRCIIKLAPWMPKKLTCIFFNLLLWATCSPSRYRYDYKRQHFYAYESNRRRYFSELTLGFDFYSRGINKRGKDLFSSYCLEHIHFSADDVVIDCGANLADLFLGLEGRLKKTNYITFEPSPKEYYCIQQNVPDAQNYNVGLSNQIGEMTFYVSSRGADSSFVRPRVFTETVTTAVTTLDHFIQKAGLSQCKLLKLEAEGFEPEILDGAQNFLKICEYVAIDGGPERGEAQLQTFSRLSNILYQSGFEMVDIHFPGNRGLFHCLQQRDTV